MVEFLIPVIGPILAIATLTIAPFVAAIPVIGPFLAFFLAALAF